MKKSKQNPYYFFNEFPPKEKNTFQDHRKKKLFTAQKYKPYSLEHLRENKDLSVVEKSGGKPLSNMLEKIGHVIVSIFNITLRLIRNLPHKIKNKYQRYKKTKSRIPRRVDRSRVYMLVGYTTKEKVNRKYFAIKQQKFFQRILTLGIFIIILFILYENLAPLINFDDLNVIFGIDNIKDLAKNDPFA